MELDPLDPTYVNERLSQPPFITVPGVVNVRDLGLYPSETFPDSVIRPGFVFRSGEISSITEDGKATLRELGVTTVYDLRSDTEIQRYETPSPDIDGVDIVRLPVFKTEDYSPEMMAKRFELYASGKTEAFMELYSQILDNGGPAFGTILRHVRDRPNEAIIFHCTAGKDRTGVAAALLLKIAGVSDDSIAEDYALTRVGREPARQMVMARLAQMPMFASNTEAALNMFTCRHETMLAFLSLLRDRYGGVEEYISTFAGLSPHDIQQIRTNLLISNENSHIDVSS
ncbi:protein-tyrosine phosphatase-like protein [Fomitopsis serialis]|uniref:protein-tyrosine phosphatase-like protein n=1 Tax=Fomitopsis serialis TaxID=139415 RepID=UPI002007702E|nr:protein-tyrosine phosphatase-like protein [Neoantrodia serialis]KAH9938005.1 protein-tyrosine phosphatase-like protein [Neoantrodia serialis]